MDKDNTTKPKLTPIQRALERVKSYPKHAYRGYAYESEKQLLAAMNCDDAICSIRAEFGDFSFVSDCMCIRSEYFDVYEDVYSILERSQDIPENVLAHIIYRYFCSMYATTRPSDFEMPVFMDKGLANVANKIACNPNRMRGLLCDLLTARQETGNPYSYIKEWEREDKQC